MIFKLKNNFAALVGIAIGFGNTAAIYIIFGATQYSDAIFWSMSIISSLQLLLQSYAEQFIFYYKNLTKNGEATCESKSFFTGVMVSSIIFSALVIFIIQACSHPIVNLFLSKISTNAYGDVFYVFSIMKWSLLLYLPCYILQSALSAHEKIASSYILSMLSQVGMLFGVGLAMVSDSVNDKLYLISCLYVVGIICSFMLGLCMAIKYLSAHVKLDLILMYSLIKNSFLIRSAHNVHNVVLNVLLNNFISGLPAGTASNYFYAKKISDVALNLFYGPTHKTLTNTYVDCIKNSEKERLYKALKMICLSVPVFFTMSYVSCFLLFPIILEYVPTLGGKLNVEQFLTVLFFLMVANVVICIEIAFGVVNQIYNRYFVFMFSNVIFILSFYIFGHVFESGGVSAISMCLLFSQLLLSGSNLYFSITKLKSVFKYD
ncbi:hypothetical protein ACK350_07125 [Aeromonas veronii]